MHNKHQEILHELETIDQRLQENKRAVAALDATIVRLEDSLQACQFQTKQYASSNSVVALEGQLIAAQKRITVLERRLQNNATRESCAQQLACHGTSSPDPIGRLQTAAPVVLARRGRSEEPADVRDDEEADIEEKISRAQSRARSREYHRSTSRDRGAYIGPHQNREFVVQTLDLL